MTQDILYKPEGNGKCEISTPALWKVGKGRKEGRKEGKKKGKKEGRKEGKKERNNE